jgi:hypothetical protein
MVVFAGESNGDVTPRVLHTPHRVYSIAADESRDELYMTVEYPPEIVVYRKLASGEEQPLRRIKGDRTGLETPHGIAIDQKNRLLFVNNWGQGINFDNAPSGQPGTRAF